MVCLPEDLALTSRQKEVVDKLQAFDEAARQIYYDGLKKFDWNYIDKQFDDALNSYRESANQTNSDLDQLPRNRVVSRSSLNDEELKKYLEIGNEAIRNNELCVVTLAGGQASRLGAEIPKGLYPLELGFENPLKNCLFYLQAAQIARLQESTGGKIVWLIMTSKSTDTETRKVVTKIAELVGLNSEQMIFFTQAEIPCLDETGHYLTGKDKILTSPNGNGGFYEAIGDLLPQLRQRGIKYFHVYCVDNILARVGEPVFLGTCISNQADCSAKTVEKSDPDEKTGIICIDHKPINDDTYHFQHKNSLFDKLRVRVIEYSEISHEQSNMLDPNTGNQKLYFRDGNIANHFFSIEFLEYVRRFPLPYHIANKNIKIVDPVKGETTVAGIKLERFIFDSFGYSKNFLIYEVSREDEFAPLKNNCSAKSDNPTTCVVALQKLHKKCVESNELDSDNLCAIYNKSLK